MKSRQDFESDLEWNEYLRYYYSGFAMQGILSNDKLRQCLLADKKIDGTNSENYIANFSVKQADRLINELNKTEKNETI